MEIDLNLLIERQLEYWGKSYNNFCTTADEVMERYNVCQFVNGICRLGIEDGCCSDKIFWLKKFHPSLISIISFLTPSFVNIEQRLNRPGPLFDGLPCRYHTKLGCSVKSLKCKLYFCGEFPTDKKFEEEIDELRNLVNKTLPPFKSLNKNEEEVLTVWRDKLKICVNNWDVWELKTMHLTGDIWRGRE